MRARYSSFGVVVEVEAPAGTSPLLRRALPPGARRVHRGAASRTYLIERDRRRWRLSVDGSSLGDVLTSAQLGDLLEGDLALHVAATAPRHVFIHAGVVAHHGRALVLPGRTHAGKSTLVARLVTSGATYYSDEYAVLDEQGRVLPYPRAMSLRRPQRAPRRHLPRRLGRRPLTVGWIIGARYRPDVAGLRLEPLSSGRTALLLMDNAVAARLAPARVLPAVRAAAAAARGAEGLRGDAATAARALLADCV